MHHDPTTPRDWVDCPRTISKTVIGDRLTVRGFEDRPTVLQRAASPAAPVVVMLHGMKGCIEKMQSQTDIEHLATAWGVTLLWLSGKPAPTRSWNTNNRCCEPASTKRIDDFAYVEAALNTIKSIGLKPSRFVVAGKSNGAGMAVSVGCRFSDVFSVVVSVSGFAGVSCRKANVSLLAMGGTADAPLGAKVAEGIASMWRSRVLTCGPKPSVERKSIAKVSTWRCNNNTYVRLAQLRGMPHLYPTYSFYNADEEILKAALGVLS